MIKHENPIWSPPRGGLDGNRIYYPGFPKRDDSTETVLNCGETAVLELAPGDVLRIDAQAGAGLALAALQQGRPASLSLLGLAAQAPLDLSPARCYLCDRLQQLVAAGVGFAELEFQRLQQQPAALLKAVESLSLVAANIVDGDAMVAGQAGGSVSLDVTRAARPATSLPQPLGEIRDEFTIDRCSARAYQLRQGEYVQVIDVAGRQCSDFMAMNSAALERGRECYIDSTITRTLMGGAYPMPGLFDKFFDQDMKPLLALVQDTVGRHDTFALACTARGYEDRGFPGHVNCSDNISAAYEPYGIRPRPAWPAINFFFNSWILPDDNRINSDEAWSRPGDYVLMEALTDVTCVSTACPDDVDPINGWNPTEIHVRIYQPDTRARKFVAYRATPEAEAKMTRETPFHPRTSALTRHFGVARDYWMPQVFDASGALEEYWACRDAATIQDMSSLRKLDILGPDAERLLQLALTRDVTKLAVNRGFYALLLDERAAVIDDGTLFRLAPDAFRWCCGADDSALQLARLAQQENFSAWIKDLSASLCNIAVQGPNSRDILRNIVFTRSAQPEFDNIKWFGFAIARLHDREGRPFMLSRSGYSGQLGYEIFCGQADVLAIWDAVCAAGQDNGLMVMGSQALEMLRVEAGLMAAGAEFGVDVDADEAGLGFALDLRKENFIGKDAIVRNRQAPRRRLVGLLLQGDEVPAHGDGVFLDRRQVGVVTSAVRSPSLQRVIAMARLAVENSTSGSELEVGRLDGHMKRLPCTVCDIPFIDPRREKPRA